MNDSRPTRTRYLVLVLAVLVAILLYLDRYCLSVAMDDVQRSLGLSPEQRAAILGAFFLTYALGQTPFGYLADRFGARKMLSAYMFVWSLFTAAMGLARGYVDLYVYRLACGLFESGAYPACAGMIKRWIPESRRGLASGIVSIGGRFGGVVAPLVTAQFMLLSGVVAPEWDRWRMPFWIFGGGGVVFAIFFYLVYRNSPHEHPACNSAERDLIEGPPKPTTTHAPAVAVQHRLPFGEVLFHPGLWCSSLAQFGINFGWAFLLLSIYEYLEKVLKADLAEKGAMGSFIALLSMPALIVGGLMVDAFSKQFGKRWGHILPMVVPRLVAAGLYLVVVALGNLWADAGELSRVQTWTIVTLFGLIAFFSDLCLPAIWSFNLAVGGRNVGFVLAWGNMWGNLGAWLSPIVLTAVQKAYGWNAVFVTCSGVFVAVAGVSLLIDATKALPEE